MFQIANVGVGGRALTQCGFGIPGVTVTLTDQNGNSRSALTNVFGYYRFDGVEVGRTYILSANPKEYQFNSQAIQVSDETTDANMIAEPWTLRQKP